MSEYNNDNHDYERALRINEGLYGKDELTYTTPVVCDNSNVRKASGFYGNTVDTDFEDTENMGLWSNPSNYFGNCYDGYYYLYSKNRDSDIGESSNYDSIVRMLENNGIYIAINFDITTVCRDCTLLNECDGSCTVLPDVIKATASHWAVGHVESILIRSHVSGNVRKVVLGICDKLSEYPLLDEDDYYERESEEYGNETVEIRLCYSRHPEDEDNPIVVFERKNPHWYGDNMEKEYKSHTSNYEYIDSRGYSRIGVITIDVIDELNDMIEADCEGDVSVLQYYPEFKDDLTVYVGKGIIDSYFELNSEDVVEEL